MGRRRALGCLCAASRAAGVRGPVKPRQLIRTGLEFLCDLKSRFLDGGKLRKEDGKRQLWISILL